MSTFVYEEIRVINVDHPTDTSSIFLDPGWASAKDVSELLIALSELHRAKYDGSGLRFEPTGKQYVVKGPLEALDVTNR